MATNDTHFGDSDEQVKKVLQKFYLSHDQLVKCKERFELCIDYGLSVEHKDKASLKMLPSYVRDTPDGTEKGDFLALDLGGTNFRILHVRLSDDPTQDVAMDSQVFQLSNELIVGPGKELFDFIALSIEEFLVQFDLHKKKMPLGFTFSFPCDQNRLDNGVLVRWTKGFNASGVIGKDVVQLLQEAINRRNYDCQLDVVAIVNDTVGTLISCAYEDRDCVIGLIVGTGTNASYMEEAANMEWFHENSGRMCINLEWGGYGDKGELENVRLDYDHKIDEASIRPGSQVYEKMISGMYMGELVRLVLVDLVNSKALFDGVLTEKLNTKYTFETAFVTQIDSDSTKLEECSQVLNYFGYADDPSYNEDEEAKPKVNCTNHDKLIVRSVCSTVSTRAAHLSACGVAALLTHITKNNIAKGLSANKRMTVGVDGTVYKKHDKFREIQQSKVVELLPKGSNIAFRLSYDGSGKGAALISAVASRMKI